MGANHRFSEMQIPFRNAVVNNGFPDAFGHSDQSFRSIMSIENVTSRRLYFSNPAVLADGIPTGVTGSANNTATIDLLTPTMSTFRNRPDLIFASGFE